MIEHLSAVFYLQRPSDSGSCTIGEELKSVEELTGWKQPELNYPPMPEGFSEVISHWSNISDVSDMGLYYYSKLNNVTLDKLEIDLIKDIDYIKNAVMNGRSSEQILELFGPEFS